MKLFSVYRSGSTKILDISATCVTKACQQFIQTLDRPAGASFKVHNPEYASLWYLDNHTIMSDYVIMRA